MEGGTWSRRSSSNDEGKFREAMGMTCSFLQVEEMYPDQEKAFLTKMIFPSVHIKSISDPSSDLNKNMISLQNRKRMNS